MPSQDGVAHAEIVETLLVVVVSVPVDGLSKLVFSVVVMFPPYTLPAYCNTGKNYMVCLSDIAPLGRSWRNANKQYKRL
jgi:hypothetical protein